MDLIKDLKKEHKQIIQYFKILHPRMNPVKNLKNVIELKKLLANHLEKEDQKLYPKFLKSNYAELKGLGNIFSELMFIYTKEIMKLLNRYERLKGAINEKDFKELINLKEKIQQRIEVEEDILFPAYNKYLH